jgi:hypothetical protein
MRALLAAFLGASLVACSTPGTEAIETRSAPIVGGEPTAPCAFPTTVSYRSRMALCTATLVHEKLITVAKHCIENDTPIDISFGDTPLMPARRVAIASCKGIDTFDFAYCILAEEVTDVPIVPILFGCEKQVITIGANVVLVGFGLIGPNTPSPGSQKRWVETSISEILPTSVVVGDETHGACFGDSGGPAYIKLADGSWRVWGVTHGGLEGAVCGARSDYLYTPAFVEWIEQQSGLDVTPCYDAKGLWNPGPKCTGFPMNPEVSDGTWASMCTENLLLSGPSSACGDAIEAGAATTGTGGTSSTGAAGSSLTATSASSDGGCSCRIANTRGGRRSFFLVLSSTLAVFTSVLRRARRAKLRSWATLRSGRAFR